MTDCVMSLHVLMFVMDAVVDQTDGVRLELRMFVLSDENVHCRPRLLMLRARMVTWRFYRRFIHLEPI